MGLKLLTPVLQENCLMSGFSLLAELKISSTPVSGFCGVGTKSRLLMLLKSCEGRASILPFELKSPALDNWDEDA